MILNVTIKFVQNSMGVWLGEKVYKQAVRLQHEAAAGLVGTDGLVSIRNHPTAVEWIGCDMGRALSIP